MVIEAFERFVMRLPAQGYGTTEFSMSVERRDALVAAGQQMAQAYFAAQEAALLNPQLDFGAETSPTAIHAADRIATHLLGLDLP